VQCIGTKFHIDWFRHSKVNKGETQTQPHTHTEIRQVDIISLPLYFDVNTSIRKGHYDFFGNEIV
jgi:hypothetical protein